MKKIILISFIMNAIMNAAGTWMWNNRTHGELKWTTIETEHFNIHYHQNLDKIALQGASIAEQIRPTLMKQMGLESLPTLDIIFTAEDEVLNGFAVPANYTIIWVDQNDAALWTGDEKWLRTVLAHELQHLVYFNTVKGPWWLPEPMNSLVHGTPAWIVEGIAEYFTEEWRPFRYELSHRYHVLRNTVHKIQDPHNDGYSKSLYLADRFGDSTISKILNHRNKFKFLDFKESFKKHTGITLKQFNEDWRRQMNTFYFSQRSQKERLEDAGVIRKLPIKRVLSFDYFSDTSRIAMITRLSKGQYDLSLVVATRDTVKEKKARQKLMRKGLKEGEKPKKVKPKWKIKELDFGRFGELNPNLDVSPNGEMIIYPKYGYGKNQSLGFDIWRVDTKTKKKVKLTNSKRANYPKFSPDGKSILFIAHENSTSQLYTMDIDGRDIKQITSNEGDVQIVTPAWSPDGRSVAFAMSESDGSMDIHTLELSTGKTQQITNSPEIDASPIWHPKGDMISYTGYYDITPNLYTYDFSNGKTIQNTDLWDLQKGVDWNAQYSTITATTFNEVDSARVLEIDPKRSATSSPVTMNTAYSSWREKSPDHPLIDIEPNKEVEILKKGKYKFYKRMRHLGTFLIPGEEGLLYNGAFTDALGQHTFGAVVVTDDTLNSIFFQYQNSTGFPIDAFWGFDIYHDANFQLQFYNRERSYLEVFNGASIWTKIPYNFGKSQSANHLLFSSLQLVKREQFFKTTRPENTVFSDPEEGDEGSINLSYLFVNKRPHIRNILSPNQGFGLKISIKNASSNIWGMFDYRKLEADIYNNKKIGPFSLYSRGRFETMNGSPPSQETLGIFDIPNYYLIGAATPGREYMSPRGFSGEPRFGDKAYMGTLELRAPVVPISIVELVKLIKIGSPTFALITDFGNAWMKGEADQEMIITLGYEFRMSLKIANVPLLTFSYGIAQEKYMWDDGQSPQSYFQMTLINPF